MPKLNKANLGRWVSLALVVLAVGFIIYFLVRDGQALLKHPIRFNPLLLGLSFLVECSGLLIAIPVWRWVLASYGIHRPLRDDIRIYTYSSLALVLPGGIWSIVSRSAFYQKHGERSALAATASIVEILVIGVAAVGVYFVTTIFQPNLSLWQNPLVGLFSLGIILSILHPRIFNRFVNWALRRANRSEVFPEAGFGFTQTILWVILEMVVLVIGGIAVFVLLASITPVTTEDLITVIAAWSAGNAASSLLFWLPGTPVLRDGAMVLSLTPNLTLPVSVVFVLLIRLWSWASLLLLAGLVWITLDLPLWFSTRRRHL